MQTDVFVLKIKDRFFSRYQNKRVVTAWSLAGAYIFRYGSSKFFKTISILEKRKIKYSKHFIAIVGNELQNPIKHKTCKEALITDTEDDLPF